MAMIAANANRIRQVVIVARIVVAIPAAFERIQPAKAIPARKTMTAPMTVNKAVIPSVSNSRGTLFNSAEDAKSSTNTISEYRNITVEAENTTMVDV